MAMELEINDDFPVGMRVLAVDDDRICLKILEGLLQSCQYEVTTTTQAKEALEMLRQNRNRFDIIITDVHMPDMDGFKLLELVGLEMDLPVIMLSINSDPKIVLKGITHGACDYLVKPVRMEELKNIWQHVIRKKRKEAKQPPTKPIIQDKNELGNIEKGNGTSSNGSSDRKGKRSLRKRKDKEQQQQQLEEQLDEDDEEGEYNETDNDESGGSGTQKKPRVVWSIELHRKFVDSVNTLGIGKGAVPKKILEHMNVEGLTRENVASHLQKYRGYLKRVSEAAPLSNLLSMGGQDMYMRMNKFDGIGDSRSLANQGRYSNFMSSYQTGGMLNRLNSPSGTNLLGISSSSPSILTTNHSQSINSPFPTLSKLESFALQQNQNSGPFQMVSKPLEPSISIPYPGNINLILLGISSSSPSILTTNHSQSINSPFPTLSKLESFALQQNQNSGPFQMVSKPLEPSISIPYPGNINLIANSLANSHKNIPPSNQNGGIYSNQSSEPFTASTGLNNPNHGVFSNIGGNLYSETFNRDPLFPSSEKMSSLGGHIMNNPLEFPSVHDTRGDSLFGHFKNTNNLVPVNNGLSSFSHNIDQSYGNSQRKTDFPSMKFENNGMSSFMQNAGSEKAATEPNIKPNGDQFMEQLRSQSGFGSIGYDSLDELLTTSMTKGEQEGNMSMNGNFGIGDFPY